MTELHVEHTSRSAFIEPPPLTGTGSFLSRITSTGSWHFGHITGFVPAESVVILFEKLLYGIFAPSPDGGLV